MRVRSDVSVMCEMVKGGERVEMSWNELGDG